MGKINVYLPNDIERRARKSKVNFSRALREAVLMMLTDRERLTEMGVHLTSDDTVAMYDSVTGFAFGPTFESEEEAECFLSYLNMKNSEDPRKLTDSQMQAYESRFHDLYEKFVRQAAESDFDSFVIQTEEDAESVVEELSDT